MRRTVTVASSQRSFAPPLSFHSADRINGTASSEMQAQPNRNVNTAASIADAGRLLEVHTDSENIRCIWPITQVIRNRRLAARQLTISTVIATADYAKANRRPAASQAITAARTAILGGDGCVSLHATPANRPTAGTPQRFARPA
jgi:hypothetical protein